MLTDINGEDSFERPLCYVLQSVIKIRFKTEWWLWCRVVPQLPYSLKRAC